MRTDPRPYSSVDLSVQVGVRNPILADNRRWPPREDALPLQRCGGARQGVSATVQLHHQPGYDRGDLLRT